MNAIRNFARRAARFMLAAAVPAAGVLSAVAFPDAAAQAIASVTRNPVPAIYVGFATVYGTFAHWARVREEWRHMLAYLAATGLALGLAACAAAMH
jgi:hypothetical protein